jgi:protein SCO1/2
MGKFKVSLKILVALVLCGMSVPSGACEKHKDGASKSAALPGNSLYHMNSKWVNQEDTVVHLNDLVGKPRIVAMVYTKCQSACPLLIQDIKVMMSRIPKALVGKIQVDLFSFDSESENYQSLQNLKAKYKLNENWSAYSGSKGSVAELAAALGIQYKKLPSGEYIHSSVIFFINEKGEIVAKQEGLGRDADEFIKKIEGSL